MLEELEVTHVALRGATQRMPSLRGTSLASRMAGGKFQSAPMTWMPGKESASPTLASMPLLYSVIPLSDLKKAQATLRGGQPSMSRMTWIKRCYTRTPPPPSGHLRPTAWRTKTATPQDVCPWAQGIAGLHRKCQLAPVLYPFLEP